MYTSNTHFFKHLPLEIIDLIFSKVTNSKDLFELGLADKLMNRVVWEYLFKLRDRKSIDNQTKLLFQLIAKNPKKLVNYCQNSVIKSNWIRMLSKELENEDADWSSQFSRLFCINILLEGPVITGLNESSIKEILSADILNDTTGTYDTYLFYIAKRVLPITLRTP